MRVLTHYLLWCAGLAQAETQTSTAERDALSRHASAKHRLVEIGVWHGVTTCRLRNAMAPDGVLIAIDPYYPGRLGFSVQKRIAHAEVSKISNGTVQWLRLTGADAARHYAHTQTDLIDFIFIDGDHSYEGLKNDWLAWSPHLASDGIVALHDSCSSATRNLEAAGSAIYTSEVILKDAGFQLLERVDTLTVLSRRSLS